MGTDYPEMSHSGTRTAAGPARARARDRRYVWHPWSAPDGDRSWLMIARGEGYRVWDIDGREFIDASALNASTGYAHPDVIAAAGRQLGRLHMVDISAASHEQAGLLAERIATYLPPALAKTLFVNSGSEGLEAALTIAAGYWSHVGQSRSRVVTFGSGYHGSTLISRSLSALPFTSHPFAEPFRLTHVGLPATPRELRSPAALPGLLADFGRAIGGDRADLPLAVVVEPLLNVGGGVVLPPGFLRGLSDLCASTGTLLVVDEVFTGYGRTGRMFACQHEGVTPDILVSSKGLAGGYLPITAVTVQQRIHESFGADPGAGVRSGLRYGHTTSGHAAACATALATLDVIEKEELAERSVPLGARLLSRLEPLAGTGDVADVRGLGLVLSVELSSAEAAARLLASTREAGLLLRQQGPVLMAVPPLIIDDRGIDAIGDRLESCLTGAR
jgi:adenosylmethionine-8-amino-7-oxononanoate aminotransferase